MEQNELKAGPLLDEDGNLIEAGFATSLIKDYDRSEIKAPASRIKEWDYYYVGNSSFGIALTIADNSYMALYSVSFLDLANNKSYTRSFMKLFTHGKTKLPSTSVIGNVKVEGNGYLLDFQNDGQKRTIQCGISNLAKNMSFECNFTLEVTNPYSMVIATPFNKRARFYYNQKINCLKAKGNCVFNGTEYSLDDCYGVLDWGRGVWTYKNTWYWSSASGMVDGEPFGFNLGYGFGDTSKATENMLFVGQNYYKLNDVTFEIPVDNDGKDDYLKPWRFTSSDGAIDLYFNPVHDRYANMNLIVLKSLQHQVFGLFSGTFKAGNKVFEIKDFPGFAEKVTNKW